TLTLPKRYPTKWIANCIKVGYGEHAFEYLSRYLYRGVLPDKDIIRITDKNVTFKYVDSETKQTKTRKLPILEFLWLILQHVLPKGLQRVRDVGFLRGNAKKLRLQIQLLLLNTKHWTQPASPKVSKAIRTCPCCQHEMTCSGVSRLSEPKGLIR
ncbi:transposase, partial [Psychromonas sp. Urea-02u-13]|uniref:transposase n=1 Tax=Psychromonas sp. Urea-02u-13 TaxID=2058326 RepID=UPI000CB7780D